MKGMRALGALTVLTQVFTHALRPTMAHAIGESCAAECDFYQMGAVTDQGSRHSSSNPMSMALAIQVCGPLPTGDQTAPGAGTGSMFVNQQGTGGTSTGVGAGRDRQGVDPNMETGNAEWDKCFKKLVNDQWPVYGQHCSAIELYKTAHKGDTFAVIAYGIAAAACTAACAAEWTGYGTAAARAACTTAGFAATATDIAWSIKIKGITEKAQESHYWGLQSGFVGGMGAGVAATSHVNGTGDVVPTCVAAGMLAAATAIRGVNLKKMGGYADKECSTLKTFISPVAVADTTGGSPGDANQPGRRNPAGDGSGGTGRHGSGGGTGTRQEPFSAEQRKALRDFPGAPQFAQAIAGDTFEPVFKNIGGKDKAADALKQAAGLGLDELAGRLASGESLSQIASSSPALAPASSALARIERDVREGNLSLKSGGALGGTYTPIAAKKPGGAGAGNNPFAMFGGMRAPVGGPGDAPKETSFEKAKRELSNDSDGDIWHEGFGGTIFQIVSQKLDRARERVDQLEWESPLNRALTGLPARKPAAASRTK
jgi:hypothetical protein